MRELYLEELVSHSCSFVLPTLQMGKGGEPGGRILKMPFRVYPHLHPQRG